MSELPLVSGRHLLHLLRHELADGVRNRWFALYTLVFAAAAVGLSWIGTAGTAEYDVSLFGRTAASMVNLVLLLVPLMGLTLGALSLAQERDRGTLIYLIAQPVSPPEVLLGKFGGLSLALTGSILLGFGTSGLLIALTGGTAEVAVFGWIVGLSVLLATISTALGLWISAAVRRASVAIGGAVFAWLSLVVLGDLGLMGSALVLDLSTSALLTLTLLNPLQTFKIAGLLALRGDLDQLGPGGELAVQIMGGWLAPVLVALLVLWTGAALLGAHRTFSKRGVL